jgi:hypothetical protein
LRICIWKEHVVGYKNKYGVGDKEEPFIQQWQKSDKRTLDLSRFNKFSLKEKESSLKASIIATYTLIIYRNDKVLEKKKQKVTKRI